MTPAQRLKVTGAVLRSKVVDAREPDCLRLRREPVDLFVGRPDLRRQQHASAAAVDAAAAARTARVTGRGTPDDADQPQGRPPSDPLPEEPRVEPWQAAPIREEQLRNGISIIPPSQRPRVVMRYGDKRDLLVSRACSTPAPRSRSVRWSSMCRVDKGHVVLFSNNPIWRGETHGSYFLVLNAILNYDNLNAGRKLDSR